LKFVYLFCKSSFWQKRPKRKGVIAVISLCWNINRDKYTDFPCNIPMNITARQIRISVYYRATLKLSNQLNTLLNQR
jgi:hypothetical protein